VPAGRGWDWRRRHRTDNFEGTQRQSAVLDQAMKALLANLQGNGRPRAATITLAATQTHDSIPHDRSGGSVPIVWDHGIDIDLEIQLRPGQR
jgi:hypothetical protein